MCCSCVWDACVRGAMCPLRAWTGRWRSRSPVACPAATLYPDNHVGGLGAPCDAAAASPAPASGHSAGPAWWTMMNGVGGALYEEAHASPPGGSPPAAPAAAPPSASSASPASVGSNPPQPPLHIPAKRYDPEPGVIRHAQPSWGYPPDAPASFEHQYPTGPTYYNLPVERERKSSLPFWPASSGEYKPYADGGCHQGFSQPCWNYAYGAPRGDQPLPYVGGEERRTAVSEASGFSHDAYGLRNYAPESVSSGPYPPPGSLPG